jgi:hypothetical protein
MITLLVLAFTFSVGWAAGRDSANTESTLLCRHALQLQFGKTREQAEQILEEQKKWER